MSQGVKRVNALVGRRMDVPTDIQMNGQMNRGSTTKNETYFKNDIFMVICVKFDYAKTST